VQANWWVFNFGNAATTISHEASVDGGFGLAASIGVAGNKMVAANDSTEHNYLIKGQTQPNGVHTFRGKVSAGQLDAGGAVITENTTTVYGFPAQEGP
jgi:hypothetical protein